MSLRSRFALLVGLSLAIGLAAPAMAAGPTARWAADAAAGDGRLIVVWKSAAPTTLHLAGVASTTSMARPMRSVVTAQAGKAAAVAASLRADPRVLTVVPDARLSLLDWPADGSPSDPLYAQQGDLAQIDVPDAWHTTTGDPSVVVAVIDSGVDLSQPDLDGVHVVDARNVVWNNADVTDDDGHGTHVTGTIVAETNNGLGMAGIAPGSTLMPIKVADSDGFIALSDVLDAVDWAREHGADVINLSLGGTLTPEQVELAQPTFTAARDAGILTVAASGNDGNAVRMYPASFNGVVSVSAVDSTDTIADFSSTGRAVDLAAPGVDLLSVAAGGGYVRESGTSMAAPHVTGVAALVRAARPGLDVDELEAVLRASAVDLGTPGHDTLYGDGRVDAAAALVEPVPDPIPDLDPPAPLPPITVAFIAPATKVSQTGSTYTVKLAITGEVADSIALVASWNQVNGKCQTSKQPIIHQVTFGPTIQLDEPEGGPLLPGLRGGDRRGVELRRGALAADPHPRPEGARRRAPKPGTGRPARRPVGPRPGAVLRAGRRPRGRRDAAGREHRAGRQGRVRLGQGVEHAGARPGQGALGPHAVPRRGRPRRRGPRRQPPRPPCTGRSPRAPDPRVEPPGRRGPARPGPSTRHAKRDWRCR